jgi:nicotinic acid phosphoribosyltransferase
MKKSPVAALFETDAYKLGHGAGGVSGHGMYPAKTEFVYSNFTNRSSRIDRVTKVASFGLQAFIQNYIVDAFEDFFAAEEDEVARLYEERVTAILGPNDIGSDHIRQLHRKGYLPLHFRTVKEGTMVPLQVPTLTVENTEPEFFWLTNYIETVLSASIWHPSTSATTAVYARKLLEGWAERTGASKEFVDWQYHDFSFRGMTSPETAASSGAAHLLSFTGTDNLNAFEWIDYLYPGDNGFIGGSVAATEHSVMCAGGQDNEFETYARLLREFPNGILSVVSDTWDLFGSVIGKVLPALHDEIMARDGKLVIRPDSGNPVHILTGTPNMQPGQADYEAAVNATGGDTRTLAERGVIEALWDQFGGTVNEKGYKLLDGHIGAIYGDSITYDRANEILALLEAKGFAADNILFGVGSFTYTYVTRDTFGSAMKATWVQIDGVGHAIQKDPATGGGKKSATGRLAVLKDDDNELYLVQNATPEQEEASELKTVWKDGQWVRKQSFADVRATLKESAANLA